MRVFIRNRTKDSCLKIPFLIYFRHFRTIMGFTGNLNRSWNSILEYKNKFWGGNKSCVCAFYTPHICDGFFQFVCHTIQILQTCGEQRIHPFLIWIFTGMLFKLFTLHADIPFFKSNISPLFQTCRHQNNLPVEGNQPPDGAFARVTRLLLLLCYGISFLALLTPCKSSKHSWIEAHINTWIPLIW